MRKCPSDSFEPAIEAKAFIDGELSVKNVFLLIFFAIKMTIPFSKAILSKIQSIFYR